MAKKRPENLLPGRNVRAQSIKQFAAEIKQRQADQSAPGNTLLSPDEIAGDYLLSRTLFTSLGGKPRVIGLDDLRTFSHNVKQLKTQLKKKKLYGGIRAKAVIDMSWDADRERANREIHMANPTHYAAVTEAGGQGTSLVVHFYTNASADSEFSHHNVNVQFLDFGAVVGSPVKAEKIVKQMTGGRIRFECSCPRHKYFFRYVATQAEYNYGRSENAFPKLTNPGLSGVACKHALRVMQVVLRSPAFQGYSARIIQKFRDNIDHTSAVERVADQRELEAQMRKEASRVRKIKTTDEKRAQRQAQPSYQRQLEAQRAMRAKAASKPAAQARVSDAKFIQMLMQGGFSQAAAQAALAAAKATMT